MEHEQGGRVPPFEDLPLLDDSHDAVRSRVSRETAEQLERLCAMVGQWNRSIRLTGNDATTALWDHIDVSLLLLPWIPAHAAMFADLGSGQGFPALVLIIATGLRGVLIEADRRKAAFLRHAAMELNVPAEICCARIEDVPPLHAEFVTARALGAADMLIRFGSRHAAATGVCAFLKGSELDAELVGAGSVPGNWRREALRPGTTLLFRPALRP